MTPSGKAVTTKMNRPPWMKSQLWGMASLTRLLA